MKIRSLKNEESKSMNNTAEKVLNEDPKSSNVDSLQKTKKIN